MNNFASRENPKLGVFYLRTDSVFSLLFGFYLSDGQGYAEGDDTRVAEDLWKKHWRRRNREASANSPTNTFGFSASGSSSGFTANIGESESFCDSFQSTQFNHHHVSAYDMMEFVQNRNGQKESQNI